MKDFRLFQAVAGAVTVSPACSQGTGLASRPLPFLKKQGSGDRLCG